MVCDIVSASQEVPDLLCPTPANASAVFAVGLCPVELPDLSPRQCVAVILELRPASIVAVIPGLMLA